MKKNETYWYKNKISYTVNLNYGKISFLAILSEMSFFSYKYLSIKIGISGGKMQKYFKQWIESMKIPSQENNLTIGA